MKKSKLFKKFQEKFDVEVKELLHSEYLKTKRTVS